MVGYNGLIMALIKFLFSRRHRLRRRPSAIAVAALVLTSALATPAEAVIARTLNLTKADITDLVRLEESLNSIKTIRARFLQVSSNGDYTEGMLHLSRPGRMRIEYDPPNPIMIIADGSNLIYIDRELEQASAIFLSMTPAAIILKDNFSFVSKDVLITGFQRSPGVIRMSLIKTDDPLEGKLTLVFSDKPLELRKWSVVDAQGITTTVSLLGPEFGLKLDPKLFDYEMPDFNKGIN